MKISERIIAAQDALTAKKDALTVAIKSMEQNPTDDALIAQVDQLATEIDAETKSIEALKRAELALASSGAPAVVKSENLGDHKDPVSFLVKTAIGTFESYLNREPIAVAIERRFGRTRDFEQLKAVSSFMVNKAAQNPAMTDVATYAQELTRVAYGAFMELLTPESAVSNLPLNRYSFDGANSILIGNRANRTKNLAGAFRGEGQPIRVGGAVLGSMTLTPKSMGVIGSFTNELFKRSTPNIESELRKWMIEDTSIALDESFLGNGAATAINPAGIQQSATGANTAVSTGDTSADITADARARLQQMASSGVGRRPYWVMNNARWIGVQLALTPAGTLAFPEAKDGKFIGYPVVTSLNVPDDIVFLVDAGEIAFAGGTPQFMGTEVATIHEEDTAPLALASGAQGSAVVATPARSLFQTNSSALRAMWELDWYVQRAGAVQTITDVSW